MDILKRIAGIRGWTGASPAIDPTSKPAYAAGQPACPSRWIVFSDTENDVSAVQNTLRFAGILDQQDELTDALEGVSLFHTGDLVNKKNPDPSVIAYWRLLQEQVSAKGGRVKLIVGNHEQEIWQKIRAGDKYALDAKQIYQVNEFIESLDLFHVAESTLFIHGYPTVEFLQALLHFKEVTGKDLNCFNADHYKKACRSINAMKQYAYVRANRQPNYLLYDVADASRYYKKQGRLVGTLLERLEIDIIVHGHRPQRSGEQVDYEFAKWIPQVRMIGNDTMVKRNGIGATVISESTGGDPDILFVNAKTASGELRRKVQETLRSPPDISPADGCAEPDIAELKSIAQG